MASSSAKDFFNGVSSFVMHVAGIIPLAGVGLMYTLCFYNVPLEFLDEECHIGRQNNVNTSDYMISSIWLASASITSTLFLTKRGADNDENLGERSFDFILALALSFGMFISLVLSTYTAMTGTCTYVDGDSRNSEAFILKAFAWTLFSSLICCSITVAYHLYFDVEKYSASMNNMYVRGLFAAICCTGNIIASIFVTVLVFENEVVSCQALRSDNDMVTTMQIFGSMLLPVLAGDTMVYTFASESPAMFGSVKSGYTNLMPLHDVFKLVFAIFVSVVMNTTSDTWENDYLYSQKLTSTACKYAHPTDGSLSDLELFSIKPHEYGKRNMTMQVLSGVLLSCAIVEFIGHLFFRSRRLTETTTGHMSTTTMYNQLMNAA